MSYIFQKLSILRFREPKISLFEVDDNSDDGDDDCSAIISKTSNSSNPGSRWATKKPKKENHPNTISKMMGPLVQVQQYTVSYRKALFSPQSQIGGKNVKNCSPGPTKVFLGSKRYN